MNLSLRFREYMTQVGSWLEDEFDQIVSKINTVWSVQHNEDGTHNLDAMGIKNIADINPDNIAYVDKTNTFLSRQIIAVDSGALLTLRDHGSVNPVWTIGTTGTDFLWVQETIATHMILVRNSGQLRLLTPTGSVFERGRTTAMGEWTLIPLNVSNYLQPSGVVSGIVQRRYAYTLIGKTVFVELDFTMAVAGVGAEIWVVLPFAPRGLRGGPCMAQEEPNSFTLAAWYIAEGLASVRFFKSDFASNWASATVNIRSTFSYEMQ